MWKTSYFRYYEPVSPFLSSNPSRLRISLLFPFSPHRYYNTDFVKYPENVLFDRNLVKYVFAEFPRTCALTRFFFEFHPRAFLYEVDHWERKLENTYTFLTKLNAFKAATEVQDYAKGMQELFFDAFHPCLRKEDRPRMRHVRLLTFRPFGLPVENSVTPLEAMDALKEDWATMYKALSTLYTSWGAIIQRHDNLERKAAAARNKNDKKEAVRLHILLMRTVREMDALVKDFTLF